MGFETKHNKNNYLSFTNQQNQFLLKPMISKNHLHCPLPPCFTARGVVFMLIELILAFHGLNSVSTSRNDYRG
jgi:hypothetical protein